jgi:RimJ/RimL family protein N-acetyltransferase
MSSLNWPDAAPTLTDGSVSLRAWEASDADAVFEACQDPDTQYWIPIPVPYLTEHARGFIEAFAPQQWSTQQGAPFAIVDTQTGRVLGACSLKGIDVNLKAAAGGYWVAPWGRGQKVAQRAVRLMCNWALTEVGLQRLEFLIEPANAASCAVAESVGCVREGLLRDKELIRGASRDVARYTLRK